MKNKQDLNPLSAVKLIKIENVNKTIIEQTNINSILSKFDLLKELILKHVDIFVYENPSSMKHSQFDMDGFYFP